MATLMRQLVADIRLLHDDQFAFLQLFDQRGKLVLVELLREQGIDRVLQRPDLSWPGLTAPTQVLDDRGHLLVHARGGRYA